MLRLLAVSLPALPQQLLNVFHARPDREVTAGKLIGRNGCVGKRDEHQEIRAEKHHRQESETLIFFFLEQIFSAGTGK